MNKKEVSMKSKLKVPKNIKILKNENITPNIGYNVTHNNMPNVTHNNIVPNVVPNIVPYYPHVYPVHEQFYTQNYYPFQSPPPFNYMQNYMQYIDPAPIMVSPIASPITYKNPINLTQANWFPVKMPASEIISKFYQMPNIIYGNSLIYPGYHHDEQI